MFRLRLYSWAILLPFLLAATPVGNALEVADPVVEIYSSGPATPEDIMRGKVGTAYIVYYSSGGSREQPLLVVRLSKSGAGEEALAEIYDTPRKNDHVPISYVDGMPLLPSDLTPAIVMTNVDGWWVRGQYVNYNIDIRVFGPVMTMWAVGGRDGWSSLIGRGEPNASIQVRDVDNDGLPDWDWRTMSAEFPGRGDYRTTYAEKMCDTETVVIAGPMPEWPFVTGSGTYGFEQETGKLRPPIVVDWTTGRIVTFSEIVTLRNQNCVYGMHSISRVLQGQVNRPNFETPFAFYDLSNQGVGYPNLLLRSQRTVEDDRALFLDSNPETQSIRYSWRNDVGDWRWDYKVDVMGQHKYDFETPIAGGRLLIDAPPYEVFPQWVLERPWPATAFVASEELRYRSSEGIYEWSLLDLTDDYYFGWQSEPDLSSYADIRSGLRGEYRVDSNKRPETYFSPIDNRLHLKWAEHGIWRLDDEQVIRVTNLDRDETIDVWSREMMAVMVEEDARTQDPTTVQPEDQTAAIPEEATVETPPKIVESLVALQGHLLYSSKSQVTLVASEYVPILFETLPPTDHDTWETHRALLAPYKDQQRDPTDLRGWLDAFTGPRSEMTGASLENVRMTDDGFRFELTLEPGFVVSGPDLLGINALSPGAYLVEYRGDAFNVSPLVPPQLTVSWQQWPDDQAAPVRLTVANNGTADATGLTAVAELDGTVVGEFAREELDVLAGNSWEMLLDIPALGEGVSVSVRIEDAEGGLHGESSLSIGSDVVTNDTLELAPFGISQVSQVVAVGAALLMLLLLLAIGVTGLRHLD